MEQWVLAEGFTGFNYLAHSFGENSYNRWSEVTVEYGTLLQGHMQDLLAMEETQTCVQRHIQADVLLPSLRAKTETARVVQNEPHSQQTEQQVVLDLIVPLIECLKQQLDQGADEYSAVAYLADEKLLAQYRRLIALWSDSLEHVDITFPLVNFTYDAKGPQPLSTHLFLCPLTPADKTALWNDDAKHFPFSEPPLDARALMSLSWKLSGTYSFSKDDDPALDTTKQEVFLELGDIVTALRLLKKGDIGVPAIYEKKHTPVLWQGIRPAGVLRGDLQSRQFPASPFVSYGLSEHEIAKVKELSNALYRLRSGKTQASLYGDMTLALRRFNQSYHRTLLEDQIIDLTVALESSLLSREKGEELSYRLSLRGTALLAPGGAWEPEKSQALLKVMYDIRSKIVHDGRLLSDLEKDINKKLQPVGISPREFPQQCEDIVRDVLKEYVLRKDATGQSMEKINEALDKFIVQSLKMQPVPEGQMTDE
jgi:hypothetical protein